MVLHGTERCEAERCVNSHESNMAEARRVQREVAAGRNAIQENRDRTNALQNCRRAQNTTAQNIHETNDSIFACVDDHADLAAMVKGYLINLLKDRVPRTPRLLENYLDPSLERHSNPQVMLAKCPECFGFFSSDATVNVIDNTTGVEFNAESIMLAICCTRMCWDMQQPHSEADGGPSFGCKFPKHSVHWRVEIFTTEGKTRSFKLPPYKSCQNLAC